jgi:uncharacterized protein
MRIFCDTSAYAKRFIEENGSDKVEEELLNATELGLSIICIPELLSAMNRRLREKSISKVQYTEIKTKFAREIVDINIVQLTDSVIKNSTRLLEKNVLRTLDAIHIASAVEWKADIFLTSDKRQIKAARSVLKKVKLI